MNIETPNLFDPPIARTEDPWSSKLAAKRIEPSRGTKKAQVLEALRAAQGAWVRGVALSTETCGGREGLRRLRELRVDGHNIQRRPDPHSKTSWQYRLVIEPVVIHGNGFELGPYVGDEVQICRCGLCGQRPYPVSEST